MNWVVGIFSFWITLDGFKNNNIYEIIFGIALCIAAIVNEIYNLKE